MFSLLYVKSQGLQKTPRTLSQVCQHQMALVIRYVAPVEFGDAQVCLQAPSHSWRRLRLTNPRSLLGYP